MPKSTAQKLRAVRRIEARATARRAAAAEHAVAAQHAAAAQHAVVQYVNGIEVIPLSVPEIARYLGFDPSEFNPIRIFVCRHVQRVQARSAVATQILRRKIKRAANEYLSELLGVPPLAAICADYYLLE